MFCEKCGTEIPKGAKFCEKCGASVEPELQEHKEGDSHKKWILGGIIGGVAVVAVVVVVLFATGVLGGKDNVVQTSADDAVHADTDTVVPQETIRPDIRTIMYDGTNIAEIQSAKEPIAVVVKDSVTSIEQSAFLRCKSLTSITLPDSVTIIGVGAFTGCDSLTSITIPDSVTGIGDGAFEECDSLTNISIPDSVTIIGDYAFAGCSNLATIKVSDENTVYDSRDNCNGIIETDTNELIAGCKSTVIPDSVTIIGGSAFVGCDSLTSITIPDSVTRIVQNAFDGCSSLATIKVSDENTVYDSRDNCNGIIETDTNELIIGCKSTVIPDSVTDIGCDAFIGCDSLTSITIPDSVTSIESGAFLRCKSLTSITLPDSVTRIGNAVFTGCESLTSIIWKGTVYTSVEDFANAVEGS